MIREHWLSQAVKRIDLCFQKKTDPGTQPNMNSTNLKPRKAANLKTPNAIRPRPLDSSLSILPMLYHR